MGEERVSLAAMLMCVCVAMQSDEESIT